MRQGQSDRPGQALFVRAIDASEGWTGGPVGSDDYEMASGELCERIARVINGVISMKTLDLGPRLGNFLTGALTRWK